jgi:putative ABC transport system permease protein
MQLRVSFCKIASWHFFLNTRMSEILRNMGRRKLRTILTISGIVIGILALTVMGSMSEYFNGLIDNAINLLGNNIVVSPAQNDFESILSTVDERRVRRVPGVSDVIPVANDTLEEFDAVSFGIPDIAYGVPAENSGTLFPAVTLQEGRGLQRGDDLSNSCRFAVGEKTEPCAGQYGNIQRP